MIFWRVQLSRSRQRLHCGNVLERAHGNGLSCNNSQRNPIFRCPPWTSPWLGVSNHCLKTTIYRSLEQSGHNKTILNKTKATRATTLWQSLSASTWCTTSVSLSLSAIRSDGQCTDRQRNLCGHLRVPHLAPLASTISVFFHNICTKLSGRHSLFSVRVLFPQVFQALIHGFAHNENAEFTESLLRSLFTI